MNLLLRGSGCLLLLALLWPELARYRLEHELATAQETVQAVLAGQRRGPEARAALQEAESRLRAQSAAAATEPRLALARGVALILLGDGREAAALLAEAIAHGERAELVLNYGRALAASGNDAAARAAFLRAAWASEQAIASLPAPVRAELMQQVVQWEAKLAAGELPAPPPLPALACAESQTCSSADAEASQL